MSVYTEKRDKLNAKLSFYEKKITEYTEKKKAVIEKLKDISRLAMAEEYECKPNELDGIISREHELVMKMQASGLSIDDILSLADSSPTATIVRDDDDQIRFYDEDETEED